MYFVGKYAAGNICRVWKYAARAGRVLEPDRAGPGLERRVRPLTAARQRTGPLNGSGSLHWAEPGTWVDLSPLH